MNRPLPKALLANPRLATWLGMAEAGTVTVTTGKVELGQGISTAMARIAADELGVDIGRIRMVPAHTDGGPDGGITAGSLSVQESGAALRHVCAEARAVLVAAAAARLGVTEADLRVADGAVTAPDGRSVTYWELDAVALLDRDASGAGVPIFAAGADTARLDLPDKIFGRPRFLHDLRLPGMLFGRVVRPPARGATLTGIDGWVAPPDVVLVRDGSFLGVVAEREEVAVDAASTLAAAARWKPLVDPLPDEEHLRDWLKAAPAETTTVVDVPATSATAVREIRASYSRPFLAHASIAPSCGVARWDRGRIEVWSHTQGVYALRKAIADALGIDAPGIVVRHVEGAGCYGHNAADDAAFDAVLLARAVPGRPVQVLWSRSDELGAAPFGPAMVVDLAAGLDDGGHVAWWRHDTWSQGHSARPGYAATPGLLAAADIEGGAPPAPAVDPPLPAGGSLRNADPLYDFPARRVTGHRVLAVAPRASALRALGAYLNVFAIESFMDALAAAAGVDPLAYRLAQLSDPRARAVLERAAEAAGWTEWTRGADRGHGIALARYKGSGAYCAAVAEVEAVHEVRVRRLVLAVDVGRVVSRDGVINQIEGGAVQATSWTLRERVRFDRTAITSTDWERYPILRFSDVPPVIVEVIEPPEQTDRPSLGAGEAAHGPTAAAIGNAVRDAVGVGIRDLPLTPENVVAAFE